MNEIGDLLDPVGRLWGMAFGLALLMLMPGKGVIRARWLAFRPIGFAISAFGLVLAVISTVYAARLGFLFWSVVPSALIHTVVFFTLGRLGSAIGHRFRQNNAQK